MSYRILAGENVDRRVVSGLRTDGHDVERVDRHDALGKGATDGTIASYAIERDCLLLTYDDFLREFTPGERPPLLFVDSDGLSGSTLVEIVTEISTAVPREDIDRPLYVSRNWL